MCGDEVATEGFLHDVPSPTVLFCSQSDCRELSAYRGELTGWGRHVLSPVTPKITNVDGSKPVVVASTAAVLAWTAMPTRQPPPGSVTATARPGRILPESCLVNRLLAESAVDRPALSGPGSRLSTPAKANDTRPEGLPT